MEVDLDAGHASLQAPHRIQSSTRLALTSHVRTASAATATGLAPPLPQSRTRRRIEDANDGAEDRVSRRQAAGGDDGRGTGGHCSIQMEQPEQRGWSLKAAGSGPPAHWAFMPVGQKSNLVNLPLRDLNARGTKRRHTAGSEGVTASATLAVVREVQSVLDRTEQGGVTLGQVTRIQRVQNWKLDAGFGVCRSKLLEAMGGDEALLNQRQLWHGTDAASLLRICCEGFGVRRANVYGRLGAGICLAADLHMAMVHATPLSGGVPAVEPALGMASQFGGTPPNLTTGRPNYGLPSNNTLHLDPAPFSFMPPSPFGSFGAPLAAVTHQALPVAFAPFGLTAGMGAFSGYSTAALPHFQRQVACSSLPPSHTPTAEHMLPLRFGAPVPPPSVPPPQPSAWSFASPPGSVPRPSSAPGSTTGASWGAFPQATGAWAPLIFTAGNPSSATPHSSALLPRPAPGGGATGAGTTGAGAAAAAFAGTGLPGHPSALHVVLLCDVVLERVGQGGPGMRRPADGFDSVGNMGGLPAQLGQEFAVFDNTQCIPAYVITIEPYV